MSTGTGYSRSPLLLKGALVELTAPLLVPIPNVIVFQYNPESVSRTLTPYAPPARGSKARISTGIVSDVVNDEASDGRQQVVIEGSVRVQPFDPQEQISLTLILDASDALERPELHPIATVAGVADRIAAIERLLYPVGSAGGLLSVDINASLGGLGGQLADVLAEIDRRETPITLFVWGPGRIVPVRVVSFSITEQYFNPLLYPVRAEVALAMQVLTPADFAGDDSLPAEIAKGAFVFTRTQQDLLALANVANTVESIVGMLPL